MNRFYKKDGTKINVTSSNSQNNIPRINFKKIDNVCVYVCVCVRVCV